MTEFSPQKTFTQQRSSSRKRVLIIAASLIFSLIILWPVFEDYFTTPAVSNKPQPVIQNKQVVNTAKDLYLDGTDKNKQPYTLTASEAQETAENGTIEVKSPHLTIKLNTGDIVSINSDKGIFFKDQRKIQLISNVTLTHSTGYKFSTELVWIHMDESRAFSETPVEGDGPQGRINAEKGFELLDKGQRIKLFGRPNLILSKGPQS